MLACETLLDGELGKNEKLLTLATKQRSSCSSAILRGRAHESTVHSKRLACTFCAQHIPSKSKAMLAPGTMQK